MSEIYFEDFSKQFKKSLSINYEIEPDTFLKDISEFDSMGKINASLLIEDLFNFTIDFETLDKTKSLSELYKVCCERSQSKNK